MRDFVMHINAAYHFTYYSRISFTVLELSTGSRGLRAGDVTRARGM